MSKRQESLDLSGIEQRIGRIGRTAAQQVARLLDRFCGRGKLRLSVFKGGREGPQALALLAQDGDQRLVRRDLAESRFGEPFFGRPLQTRIFLQIGADGRKPVAEFTQPVHLDAAKLVHSGRKTG